MNKTIKEKTKQYLGDSVYASFDGYSVILTTENGLPLDPSNRITLEPIVIKAFNRYCVECKISEVT